jgi:hypothetical protein
MKGSLGVADMEDLAQERALALLEDRDPAEAERLYRNQEARWQEATTYLDETSDWATIHAASTPQSIRPSAGRKPVNYSPAVLAAKRAYSREWWKRKGTAYRKQRRMAKAS